MTSLYVLKRNGKKQLFNKAKVARACVKAGASKAAAIEIAKVIETKFSMVKSEDLAKTVVAHLKKKSPKAAKEFVTYRSKKMKKR
jgi:transcriptional regulator NrdR family protein